MIHQLHEVTIETLVEENAQLRQQLAQIEQICQRQAHLLNHLSNPIECHTPATRTHDHGLTSEVCVFYDLSERIPDGLLIMDQAGRILYANRAYTALTLIQYDPVGMMIHDLWHFERDYSFERIVAVAAEGAWRGVVPYHRGDGTNIIGHITVFQIGNSEQTLPIFAWVIRDITEHGRAEEELQRTNAQLRESLNEIQQYNRDTALLNGVSDMLQSCLTIEGAYRFVARVASQLFANESGALYNINRQSGMTEAMVTWGHNPPTEEPFLPEACVAMRTGCVHLVEASDEITRCDHIHAETAIASACIPLVAQGELLGMLHLRSSYDSPHNHERWEWLAMMIADRLAQALANLYLRQRLRDLAIHDALTNLFNRRYLDEVLERELAQATRHQRSVGVIILDIDHFKQFNTIHGLRGGDAALRAVGAFLQANIRSSDIACRFGGEEFTLILPEASLQDTIRRAEELRQAIKQLQVEHQGQILQTITISLGVASFPDHGDTAEAIIAAADHALGQAKADGRDRVVTADRVY